MNLSEFELSALLRFIPEEGRLMLKGDRMLIFRQEAFSFLQTLLSEQLGDRVTHAILSQFGYRCGYGDFGVLSKGFDWDSEQDELGCGPLMHGWEGLVAVETTCMKFDRASGSFRFTGIWRNSYEAEIFQKRFGMATQPVCSSLTGYASGWCTAFFGKPLLAIEHKCMGKGDKHCTWEILPVDVWGSEADYWREALKATNLSIAQNLEGQVEKRTQEVERMVDELKQKNSRLLELDHLKSRFLANISHEVRTPLTLMLAPLQKLLACKSLDAKMVEVELQRMSRNGGRLYRLVNQLLDYSKLEAGEMKLERQWFDPVEVVRQLLDEAVGQSEAKQIALSFHTEGVVPSVRLDREKFEKILINLVNNALKFTPVGGWIKVKIACCGGNLIVTVNDNGPGIASKDKARVFERFQQGDISATRKHEGTGLGLSLVKEFCELHGGTIQLESQDGQGARFIVTLPVEVGGTGAKQASSEFELPRFAGHEKWAIQKQERVDHSYLPQIIVADDNPDMRDYMLRLLSDKYQVLEAENGMQALALAQDMEPKLILADVMMPELDGFGLVRALKGHPGTCYIPVILVTARAGPEASVDGLKAGADDYIVKPFIDAELLARVEAAARMRDTYDQLAQQKAELAKEVAKRVRAEEETRAAQEQFALASREAGRAEVATSILHNAGNVLNSVSVSISMLLEHSGGKPSRLIDKIFEMVAQHKENLSDFLASEQGRVVFTALLELLAILRDNDVTVLSELNAVENQIEHLCAIISDQNAFARASSLRENTDVNELARHAIRLVAPMTKNYFKIIEDFTPNLPALNLDKHKALQVLVNIIKNAIEALAGAPGTEKRVTLFTGLQDEKLVIKVQDTGVGISEETILRIFQSGYSTKKRGNGFGLHSSANLARELGGHLSAESEGVGLGASFTLSFPIKNLNDTKIKSRVSTD